MYFLLLAFEIMNTAVEKLCDRVTTDLDSEIKKIVEEGYERGKKVLNDKIDDLHKLAKELLTYETLSGDEIRDLIQKNIYQY